MRKGYIGTFKRPAATRGVKMEQRYTYKETRKAETIESFEEMRERIHAGEWIINGNLKLTAIHEPAGREPYASVRPIERGSLEKGYLILGEQRQLSADEFISETVYTRKK